MHKFCELLEYDDLIEFFPLLKSREKLQQQDKKCRKIAERLSPDINKVYEIRASVHEAIFNSNTSNYKKLVEKLGSQVESISGKL